MSASARGAGDGGDEIAALVERAFHYRGDVTVRTAAGVEVVGYLFNRNDRGDDRSAQLFETGTGREVAIPYSDIRDVLFTGRDTAAPRQAADGPGPADGRGPEASGRTTATP
ncbi:MAG: hypothetical protein OXH67_10415 [Acidimicrobiaceae bacterium]|nr:hypothetical protein [Acidimicrobiaceae bacterium]